MNKNKASNFGKSYKNTICLNNCLRPVKLVECVEENSTVYCTLLGEDGNLKKVVLDDKLIPLKGRLRTRDYDFIEASFYKTVAKSS